MKKENKTIETYLPLFPGFYNTIFEPDETSEIEHINDERETKGLEPLKGDDFSFNYDEYYKDVAEKCCEYIESELKDLNLITELKYQCVSSPKYYNYSNDAIHIEITPNIKEIKKHLIADVESFEIFLKDNYTSRSGFISFHSTESIDWLENITDPHKLGAILEYILYYQDITEEDLYYIMTDVYLSVDNYELHLNKIVCPHCGEVQDTEDIMHEYNKIRDTQQKIYKDLNSGKEPKFKTFNEWAKENIIYCHHCSEVLNQF